MRKSKAHLNCCNLILTHLYNSVKSSRWILISFKSSRYFVHFKGQPTTTNPKSQHWFFHSIAYKLKCEHQFEYRFCHFPAHIRLWADNLAHQKPNPHDWIWFGFATFFSLFWLLSKPYFGAIRFSVQTASSFWPFSHFIFFLFSCRFNHSIQNE